jgi:hypothetical protein
VTIPEFCRGLLLVLSQILTGSYFVAVIPQLFFLLGNIHNEYILSTEVSSDSLPSKFLITKRKMKITG